MTLESLSLETLVYNFHGEGACHGDSGGPAFSEIGGVWHQIGVTSWGDPSCSSTGHYQRLDVLGPWLEAQGLPAPRALDCEAPGCDDQCEEDQDCWGMMCPSGDCTAPSGRCTGDGACDADCGYADPDCGGGGSQDVCAVYGLYGNGVCNQGCFKPDPDCAPQQCYPGYDPYAGVCYAGALCGQVAAVLELLRVGAGGPRYLVGAARCDPTRGWSHLAHSGRTKPHRPAALLHRAVCVRSKPGVDRVDATEPGGLASCGATQPGGLSRLPELGRR